MTIHQTDFTVSRLRIANESHMIPLMIEQGPSRQMIREVFQNTVEVQRAHGEMIRKVYIRGIHVPGYSGRKLNIGNTGVGMTAEDLERITNLNESLKATGTKSKENRGHGYKIAALRYNALGVVIISRLHGIISTVTLCKDSDGTWGRLERHNEEEDRSEESWVLSRSEISEAQAAAWKSMYGDDDFTEFTFLGMTENQDTFADPYGDGSKDENFVRRELTNRYFEIPQVERVGIPVSVRYSPDPEASKPEVLYFGDKIDFPADIIANRKLFKVEAVQAGDAEILYIHAQNSTARKAFPSRCGILYESEQYDVKLAERWANAAGGFGLPGIGPQLSILIRYADGTLESDLYRQNLSKGQTEIRHDTIQKLIYDLRPEWVLKLLGGAKPSDPKEMTEELEDFVNQLRAVKASSKMDTAFKAEKPTKKPSGQANPESERQPGTGESKPKTDEVDAKLSEAGTLRPTPSLIPAFDFRDAKGIPDLVHRTVKFEPQAGPAGTLTLNTASTEITRFVDLVLATERSFDKERVRLHVRNQINREIWTRVAKLIITARFSKGTKGWRDADVQEALSVAALNMAVLSFQFDVAAFAFRLQRTQAYRSTLAGGYSDEPTNFILVPDTAETA